GNDGAVPEGEDQSTRRLPADVHTDPRILRAVLGAARKRRAAPSAVLRLAAKPFRTGSLLRAAVDQRRHHDRHDVAATGEPRHGPAATEDDEGDADSLRRAVPVLPGRPRALLRRQRRLVAVAAVGDHQAHAGSRRQSSSGMTQNTDTIAAIATAPGAGGIGIV